MRSPMPAGVGETLGEVFVSGCSRAHSLNQFMIFEVYRFPFAFRVIFR